MSPKRGHDLPEVAGHIPADRADTTTVQPPQTDARASREGDDELVEAKGFMDAGFETAPDIILRFDRAFRHLYVNPAITRTTGLPREHFVGRTNRELGYPEKLCEKWERHLEAVFESG